MFPFYFISLCFTLFPISLFSHSISFPFFYSVFSLYFLYLLIIILFLSVFHVFVLLCHFTFSFLSLCTFLLYFSFLISLFVFLFTFLLSNFFFYFLLYFLLAVSIFSNFTFIRQFFSPSSFSSSSFNTLDLLYSFHFPSVLSLCIFSLLSHYIP